MKIKSSSLDRWNSDKAAELYGVRNWGGGYFNINERGEVAATPRGAPGSPAVSLYEVVQGLKERGMNMPVLLRFGDILDSRIQILHEGFARAIREAGYQGGYRGVYPIKVNQQEQVVEEVSRYGARFHHGLEAGSKAELIAAISFMQGDQALLICNGYKDQEYIDLGLYARKMGVQCVLVLENPRELPTILARAAALNVRPMIGIRIKIATQASGHWTESGGDRSVFGLNMAQVIEVVDLLRKENMLDCLQLLHFHLGSQITNIRDIRTGVAEACRVYAGLVQEGAAMGMLDLGGGLAVDYDGSQTNFKCSSNYNLGEYCVDIIEVVMTVMNEAGIPHPLIVTESGRATVAYYSVLLFNILDVARFEASSRPEELPADAHEQTRSLVDVARALTGKNAQECFNDALFYRDEIRQLFRVGALDLRERARAEQIFWSIVLKIADSISSLKTIPDEFEDLDRVLADIYYCNFSVFQSLPDAWAIEQLFPIMPIHRLGEEPTRMAILSDITCDCDGKIDRFVDLHDVKRALPLHELRNGDEYYLGVFLVGAYQETLGDLHNLLGDTNVVTIRVTDAGEVQYAREIEGDSVADVLSYVEYDIKAMEARVRDLAEQAVRKNLISAQERRSLMEAYHAGIHGYTYFER